MALSLAIYKVVKKMGKALGLNIAITKISNTEKGSYESVFPYATYAPWIDDRTFMESFKIVKNYTLVDMYRCFELWQLVSEVSHLEGALIEIGVWKGGTGTLIAKKASMENIKEPVYLCDTFSGVVKAGTKDSYYKGGEHADTSVKTVEKLSEKLSVSNYKILKGIFPEDTAEQVTDKIFRFCHIDVDVYQSAKDILNWIWPKMQTGGLIVFDDYGFSGCSGITQFVNEERKKSDRMVIHNLNGHAIIVKL